SALCRIRVKVDRVEFPLGAAAAVIDGEAAIGDAYFVQHLTVEAAGSGIQSELPKLIDPGEQGGYIGSQAAWRQRLQGKDTGIVLLLLAGSRRRSRRRARRGLRLVQL